MTAEAGPPRRPGYVTGDQSAQGSPAGAEADERPPATTGALLLARVRAVGYALSDAGGETVRAASWAAAAVDRRLVEVSNPTDDARVVVLGWADGAGPNPDQHPSASPRHLSGVPYLVWAACLAAAWPDAASDPYPGRPFRRNDILRTCVHLGGSHNSVVGALDTVLPSAGLITFVNGTGTLGPAAAALPQDTWSQLRRVHDRLPHSRLGKIAEPPVTEPQHADVASGIGPRWIPGPPARPTTPHETTVSAVVTALELAQGPVARVDLPMLADPAIRTAVSAALGACGRVLVDVAGHSWTTGYPDPIASALALDRCGTLTPHGRAVLALVLLRTIAIPRARGLHEDDSWTTSEYATSLEELAKNRQLTQTAIVDALRGLRRAGYVATTATGGYIPGPALVRLTPRLRAMLWEDLVVLGRPNGYMANRIRQRRAAAVIPGSGATGTAHANEDPE